VSLPLIAEGRGAETVGREATERPHPGVDAGPSHDFTGGTASIGIRSLSSVAGGVWPGACHPMSGYHRPSRPEDWDGHDGLRRSPALMSTGFPFTPRFDGESRRRDDTPGRRGDPVAGIADADGQQSAVGAAALGAPAPGLRPRL
jgi:hypothetical protein